MFRSVLGFKTAVFAVMSAEAIEGFPSDLTWLVHEKDTDAFHWYSRNETGCLAHNRQSLANGGNAYWSRVEGVS